jgi:hypothetical protein
VAVGGSGVAAGGVAVGNGLGDVGVGRGDACSVGVGEGGSTVDPSVVGVTVGVVIVSVTVAPGRRVAAGVRVTISVSRPVLVAEAVVSTASGSKIPVPSLLSNNAPDGRVID